MKFLLLCITLLFLSACSTHSEYKQEQWPSQLPPVEYYIEHFEQDSANQQVMTLRQYLLWVRRLYLGWALYSNGWLELSSNLANTIEDEQNRALATEKLATMGRIISPEWAKHTRFSSIKTRHLVVWGNALNESPVHNQQLKIIDQVLADAHSLIDGQLAAKDITANRYYSQERFEDFESSF